MKKFISGFFVLIAVFMLQFSLNFWAGFSLYFNPLLFSLILVSLFYDLKTTIIWVIVGGFLLDLFSLFNFGVHTISLIAMIFLVHYFFQKFITNHTFYSFLILTAASTFFYYLLIITTTSLLSALNFSAYTWLMDKPLFLAVSAQIFINSALMGLIYFFISFFSNRLKANFILKDKY